MKHGFAEYAVEIAAEIGEELVQNARLTPAATELPPNPATVPVARALQAAALSLRVVPTYPAAAKSAGIQGTVVLDAVIGRDGVPVTLQVQGAPNPELARAAVEAVNQWRYRPASVKGQAVEVQTDIAVTFTLQP